MGWGGREGLGEGRFIVGPFGLLSAKTLGLIFL
jgi:hypothetical protein